jgi:hypothetical protein
MCAVRERPGAEQSRHLNIGYFWINDLITRKIVSLIYCPTKLMAADHWPMQYRDPYSSHSEAWFLATLLIAK